MWLGSPMFPTFMAKKPVLFMVRPHHGALGAFAQINPIWQFARTTLRRSPTRQPDWYMGWLDGALRIMPSWEFAWVHTVPLEVFLPAVISPASSSISALMWPALERRFTGDNALHNLLDRPRDRPKRTAAGAAMLALLFTLFAVQFDRCAGQLLPRLAELRLCAFRVLTFVVPVIVGFVTYGDVPGDAGCAGHSGSASGP